MPYPTWMSTESCHSKLHGRHVDRAFLAWMSIFEVTGVVCFTWTFLVSWLNTACQGARQEHRQLRGDTRKWQFGLLRRKKLCYDLFFSFLADFWFDSYCALSSFLSMCLSRMLPSTVNYGCRRPAVATALLGRKYFNTWKTGNGDIYAQSVKCKTSWISTLFKCWSRLVCHSVMWGDEEGKDLGSTIRYVFLWLRILVFFVKVNPPLTQKRQDNKSGKPSDFIEKFLTCTNLRWRDYFIV